MLGARLRNQLKLSGPPATWPRPRPLSGKIICAPARHSWYKAVNQIWSL